MANYNHQFLSLCEHLIWANTCLTEIARGRGREHAVKQQRLSSYNRVHDQHLTGMLGLE